MDCEVPRGNPTSDEIASLLRSAKTIAVVGLSPKPERPSHGVSAYMQAQGYKIIPVNPGHSEILGEKCYRSLEDVPNSVDIVDIFRDPSAVPEIVDQAIARKAKAVWMQEGIVHNEAAEKARKAGLLVVMNRCIYKEHARLS
jgi:predicted CoA-binding protein